jgi:hypothetical protein
LAPLIWAAVLHVAPGLEPLNRLITLGRFASANATSEIPQPEVCAP